MSVPASAAPPLGARVGVCVVVPTLGRGGVERVAWRLLGRFDRERYAPSLVLFSQAQDGFAPPADVPVRELRSRSLRTHVLELAALWRAAAPDVVIAQAAGASVVALLARRLSRRTFPILVVLHTPIGVELARQPEWVMALAVKRLLPLADSVTAVSAGAAEDIAAFMGWPAGRVGVLANPAFDDTILAEAATPFDHPFFTGDTHVIVAVGRFVDQKDFPTLLRAVARLAPDDPALRLLLLGEGPDRPALEALVAELSLGDVVDLPGWASNPYPAMARAGAVVLSSAWEALPTVLIEALALGVPVIATDCVAGPREILCDGAYGVLVPVGDADAMAAAIAQTLADPPPAAALQKRAAAYGAPAMAGYERLIDDLVAARRTR